MIKTSVKFAIHDKKAGVLEKGNNWARTQTIAIGSNNKVMTWDEEIYTYFNFLKKYSCNRVIYALIFFVKRQAANLCNELTL